MSLIRICNRCAAPAIKTDAVSSLKTLVIPQALPATNPVTGDVGVNVALAFDPEDLCPICQVSALIVYAQALGPEVIKNVIATLTVLRASSSITVTADTVDQATADQALVDLA